MRLLFVAVFTIAVASVCGGNQDFKDNGSIIDPQMFKLMISTRPFTGEKYTQNENMTAYSVPGDIIIRIDDLKYAISPDNGNRSDAKLVFVNGRHHDGIQKYPPRPRPLWSNLNPSRPGGHIENGKNWWIAGGGTPPNPVEVGSPALETSKKQKESKYEIIDLRSLT